MIELTLSKKPIMSDEKIKTSGFYILGKHNDCDIEPLISEHKMFFTKNSPAPRLLKCGHKTEWWLVIDS